MRVPASVIALAAAVTAAAQSPAPPAILGDWYGGAGWATDSIAIGFRFKYNDQHELKAYLYQPTLNFYGLELPGVVKEDSGIFILREYAIHAKVHGDTATGTFFPFNAPMLLVRTPVFPSESPIPDLPAGPGPAWRVKLNAPIWAPVAVRDHFAYVGTEGGVFHAVDVTTHTIAWTFPAGRPIIGEALATDSAVFFACDNGYLFKLDRATGKEIWRYDLGDSRVSRILPHQTVYDYDFKAPAPVLAGGVIFIGSGDSSFHAVNAATGKRVWRASVNGKVRSTAVLYKRGVIVGSMGGNEYAFDRATGKQIWVKETHGQLTSTPIVMGDRLILGAWDGLVAAINADSAKTLWRMLFWGSAVESDPVAEDTTFIIGASDLRRVSRIDARSGKVYWRTDVYGWAWARPLETSDRIFQSVASGTPYQMRHVASFTALDRATGAIIWRWPMPEWPGAYMNGFTGGAALAGDVVLAGAVDGTLYAFPAH
jgi:outer membrane protein assembly factor BamB